MNTTERNMHKMINDALGMDITYLYASAKELGGTIWEIACEGGLLQAVDYLELHMDGDITGEVLLAGNIEPVKDDGSYQMWADDCCYIGDGENKGWLCTKSTGSVLVKPDVFAVQQAMNTYYAERIIRQTTDSTFCIERIDFNDENIWNHISELMIETLPKNWLVEFLHGNLSVSYRVLAYQIGYLKQYFPEVYVTIWERPYFPEYQDQDLPFGKEDLSADLGIVIGQRYSQAAIYRECGAYGAESEQESYTLYANAPCDEAVNLRHRYRGSGSLQSPGRACSAMGLALKKMREDYTESRTSQLKQVRICAIQPLPEAGALLYEMNNKKKALEETAASQTEVDRIDLLAYDELELFKTLYTKDITGLISKAAELAELKNCQIEQRLSKPIAAYYQQEERYRLSQDENAYVLYLDEAGVQVGLVCKTSEQLDVIVESPFNTFIIRQFEDQIFEEMVKLIQPKLDIFSIKADDEDVQALRQDVGRIRRQFARNDQAVVVFNNGWLSLSEKLPRSVYESCLAKALQESAYELDYLSLNEKAAAIIQDSGIKKLYVAGNLADDLLVRKQLEAGSFGGVKEIAIAGAPEHVITNGLCLY